MKKINVIIVDDSALIRKMLKEIFSRTEDIHVLDTASDPLEAREKIKSLNPDVITLDIEMPKMDGLLFLEKIMSLRPMPVIMSSSLTQKGAEETLRAMEIGAVDCVGKPMSTADEDLQSYADEICMKVRMASSAKVGRRNRVPIPKVQNKNYKLSSDAPKLIAVGASTGGVETLVEIMTQLPPTCPPIAITQHMPPLFTASFAKRLSGLCKFPIYEASEGMVLKSGMGCIAPGGKHLKILKKNTVISCHITDEAPVRNHKPSIDVMFNSIVDSVGANTLGIILTGMGKDGAEGLLNLRKAGAYTIGQDEKSCVVYGMPQAAFKMGAVTKVLSLSDMASEIISRSFQ